MKLPQRHKNILLKEKEDIEKYEINTFIEGYIWINEKYKNVIIENLHVTNFIKMYPHIMILLHDEGLINITEEVEKLKSFFDNIKLGININNTQSEYSKWEIWINSLYGKLLKKPNGKLIHGLVSKYINLLFDEILEKNLHNIIYIDTDIIISFNPISLENCPLPISTEILTLGVFNQKKRYVFYDSHDIKVKGYPVEKHEEVKREIQQKIRDIKLNKIFS